MLLGRWLLLILLFDSGTSKRCKACADDLAVSLSDYDVAGFLKPFQLPHYVGEWRFALSRFWFLGVISYCTRINHIGLIEALKNPLPNLFGRPFLHGEETIRELMGESTKRGGV